MRSSSWRVLALIVVAAAVMLLATSDAGAQCSMCRAALTSAATNARFVRNFNIGVLVLLVPPATIFCSIFIVLKRYRGNG